MRTIIILLVSLFITSCTYPNHEQKYTRLICKSGLVTPWVKLVSFHIYPEGRVTYKMDGNRIHDYIKKDDSCVQIYKKAVPGKQNG